MCQRFIKLLALAVMTLCASTATAAVVRGTVVDPTGEPLIDASVRLLSLPDSALVKGVVTNDSGRFSISNVKSGKYALKVAYIGYNTLYKDVKVGSEDVSVGNLQMNETSYSLKEASVSARRTEIKVKEDTIEFNADSYHTQPNAVVEDLLKRLPGVEVSSEGKITANGKEVSKILLDGKEFFSDDPKVASKNLPANMIDKLQVVDRKSDLARLTGVDDGEDETVINLTVKKGMNNGWFGTVMGGYGTDKRYEGSFNVNRFWNGNQVTILGAANNINELGFTDSNGGRFRRFGGNNGIDTSQAVGINFNVGKEEIIRVGGDIMWSHNDRETLQRQNRQYLFEDSTSFLNSDKAARDRGNNLRADFRVQWNPDSFNVIDFQPSFSFNANDSDSKEYSETLAGDAARSLVTKSVNISDSKGKSYEAGGRLIYSHKFKNRPGRSFSIHANYRFSNVDEDINTISYNRFFRLPEPEDDYAQYTDNHTWSNSINSRITWTEPIGDVKNGRFLTVAYNINNRWNNADKLVYDRGFLPEFDDEGFPLVDYSTMTLNEDLTNRYRNTFTTQRFQVGFKQVRKNYTIDLGLAAVPSKSKSENLTNADKSLTNTTFYISPYLRYRYKMGRSRNLNIDYRSRSNNPSISQLQPVEDKSDPLRIVIGNPDLKPTFTHNVRARFSDFNMESQRSIMSFLDGSYALNSIVSKTIYNPETGGQTTTYVNENGIFSLMGACMVSFPLKNRNWQFTSHFFGRYNSTVGYNNGDRNRTNTVGLNFGPGIAFRPDNFQFEIRPTYSLQATKSELKLSGNSTVHTYGAMLNASYYTPFGLSIDTDFRFSGTHGYTSGYNKNTWMWNASISQQLLRDKSLTVALKVYDLLQQNKNIQRNVTANYIDDVEYNSLTRYFMITLSYRFNTFGKGNEPESRNMMGPGGPGGPPRGRGGMGGPPPGGGRRF
ncbi:MAG: TonB-dependent receptor [Muribaculaceae bacterium]|nr:TonB-dependent receptor [Muribaculaceae bacterium]